MDRIAEMTSEVFVEINAQNERAAKGEIQACIHGIANSQRLKAEAIVKYDLEINAFKKRLSEVKITQVNAADVLG